MRRRIGGCLDGEMVVFCGEKSGDYGEKLNGLEAKEKEVHDVYYVIAIVSLVIGPQPRNR